MNWSSAAYLDQVRLMLAVLPHVAARTDFALKGGTAINFFYRNGPRLSVDLDLHYLPEEDRELAMKGIAQNMEAIRTATLDSLPGCQATIDPTTFNVQIVHNRTRIKLEPNSVIRGQLLPTNRLPLCQSIGDYFGTTASIECVNRSELYAGKLCAALQRQHPRDLFDIKLLLDEEGGLTRDVMDAFVVYIASQGKPIAEMLTPRRQPVEALYHSQFVGMADQEFPLEDMLTIQANLPNLVWSSFKDDDRQFLLGYKQGQPDWSLIRHSDAARLPAIRWKLLNLDDLSQKNPVKYRLAINRLEQVLTNGPPPYEDG